MATVQQNQNLPYTPLEPLPIPKGDPRLLKKIAVSVALVATIVFFTASLGAWLSFSFGGFSAAKGAIGGTLIGVVGGIIALSQIERTSPLAEYRVKTLEKIDGTVSEPRAKEGIRRLKEFFTSPLTRLAEPNTLHMLHKEITLVTDHINPNREDVQKVWRPLLEDLHETEILDFAHQPLTLDFSSVLDKEKKKSIEPEARWVDPKEKGLEGTVQKIDALQKRCFREIRRVPIEELKKALKEERMLSLVIEDKKTKTLMGYALVQFVVKEEKRVLEISSLARKPEAAGLWIGSDLLQKTLEMAPPNTSSQVTIEKRNPATALFAKFGFELKTHLPEERVLLEKVPNGQKSSE